MALVARCQIATNWARWRPVQLLLREITISLAAAFLSRYPQGWLEVPSAEGIDYEPLQAPCPATLRGKPIDSRKWPTCSAARPAPAASHAGSRWSYFSEVPGDSAVDLVSLDRSGSVIRWDASVFRLQARLVCAASAGAGPCSGRAGLENRGGTWNPLIPSGVHLVLQAA